MIVKSLETENFRSCPDGVYEFGKVNFLVGDNGTGKTSLQNALRYALNGKLPEDPIRRGEDHLKVSLVIGDGQDTTVERVTYAPDTYRINGEDKKQQDFLLEVRKCREHCRKDGVGVRAGSQSNPAFYNQMPDVLWQFLLEGKTPVTGMQGAKVLELKTDDGTTFYMAKSRPSGVRIDGKAATAKMTGALYSDRIGGDVKAIDLVSSSETLAGMQMPDVAKYLMGLLPVSIDFDRLSELASFTQEEQDLLRPVFPASPAPIVPSDVANAYKMLVSARTSISSRMQTLKARSQFEGNLPPVSENDVQEKLKELSRQAAVFSKIQESWSIFQKRTKERETAMQNVKRWVHEYNTMGPLEPPQGGELTALQGQEAKLRQAMLEAERAITGYRQSCVPLQRMLNNLDTPVCPLCDKLTCRTDKTAVKSDLKQAIDSNMQCVKETQERLYAMQQELPGILAKEEEVRRKTTLYQNKVTLYRQIADLKAAIPEEPAQPEPLPDLTKLQTEIRQYQSWQKQYLIYGECQKALEEYNQVKAQWELYNTLVKKCEPKKGMITNVILKVLFTPFESQLNSFVQSVYPDMELSFQMGDEGLKLLCRPHGRDCMLPLGALSTGEKYLALFALMDLISGISNVRILVFDNLEALDSQTLGNLLELFESDGVQERYDHIILSGVGHESILNALARYPDIRVINF